MDLPERTVDGQKDALRRIEIAESKLIARELAAYRLYSRLGQPRLSPSLQEQFFQLFLQGKTCEEIVRLNKGYSLAQIVTARIEGDWDAIRDEYIQNLLATSRGRYQQATLESVQFMADILAVANKKFGDAARLYLQTGDEKYLKHFQIENIHQYKQIIEILQKLTGVDQQKPPSMQKVEGDITHHHVVEQPIPDVRKPMPPESAHQALQAALQAANPPKAREDE
jgi:hypothetical protein